MAVTMQDIARGLDVSVVTVSKVLRDKGKISVATRKRVLRRAKELNYQANWIARSLVTRRTFTIGLLLPDFTHPFFAEIAKAIAETVRPHGYHVIISYFEENPQLEKSEAESLLARQVDGLIIASAQSGAAAFEHIRKRNTPFILIDRPIAGVRASFVGVDNQAMGHLATTHLIERGCRRIAHLRGPNIGIAKGRMEGFRRALAKHRLSLPAGYIVDAGYQDQSGHEAMRKLLRATPRPDGVFCYNDPVAIGAMRAISEAGLRVPGDIAVAGAGNVHYSDFLAVPLTTVDQGTFEIGTRAANLLLERIACKRKLRPKKILIGPRLVIRESTEGCSPGRKGGATASGQNKKKNHRVPRENAKLSDKIMRREGNKAMPISKRANIGVALVALVAVLIAAPLLSAQDKGLASTPPMGWNSWNKFGCNVSEDMIRQMADAMVKSGMKEAGYQYVVIDDCWQVERDQSGNIVADAKLFPSGIKALADYLHSLGLKFGIYSDAGSKTCAKRPGSLGHEYQDASQYAAWGVDYLKYDWCNTTTQDAQAAYALIRSALNATGRPMVLSICEWGTAKPWLWGERVGGNLWRTTGDISDMWQGEDKHHLGVVDILDLQDGLQGYAGPGHWNDPDMLEVGNGGMTTDEDRAHFSLWSILAAPLLAGNDLRDMKPEIHDILTNKEVIAVNQDPLGRQGRRVRKDGDLEVWAKQMKDGSRSVVLLNRDTSEKEIAVSWEDIGYPSHLSAGVRDLWRAKDLGQFKGKFSAPVAPHSVVMVRVAP